jgi:hypothetical protein
MPKPKPHLDRLPAKTPEPEPGESTYGWTYAYQYAGRLRTLSFEVEVTTKTATFLEAALRVALAFQESRRRSRCKLAEITEVRILVDRVLAEMGAATRPATVPALARRYGVPAATVRGFLTAFGRYRRDEGTEGRRAAALATDPLLRLKHKPGPRKPRP